MKIGLESVEQREDLVASTEGVLNRNKLACHLRGMRPTFK